MLQHAIAKMLASHQARLIYKDQIFTAQQLAQRVATLQQRLKKMSCGSGPVALCLPNSPELLCWQLACFLQGITIVPIIYEQEAPFIQQVLQLTNPRYLLITSEKQQALLKHCLTPTCCIETIDDTHQAILSAATTSTVSLDATPINNTDLAMIIFSSGTTGKAKGIMHTYQSTQGFMQTLIEILSIERDLTYVVAQPMGHIGGITTTLITLIYEGTAILLEKFELAAYMQTLLCYQPTHINLHTPLFYDLLNHPNLNKKAFSKIKVCFAGGDDIPVELPALFTSKTSAPMRVGYGMTEIGIILINTKPYDQHKGSCGVKIPSAEIVLKNEKGNAVSQGEVGEIWVKSPACCLGYWNLPEINQRIFQDAWFNTQDLAYMDADGYYWYMGRASQIIHRGTQRIYPQTIEQALFAYPAIKSAAVISVKDEKEGEVPIAFVALKIDVDSAKENLTKEKIFHHLTQYLRPWQLPKQLIILEKLPLNLTGKIDRGKLGTIYARHGLKN